MDIDLTCNYIKCRKRLTSAAFVTTCSHIFCFEHGNLVCEQHSTCPACEDSITGEMNIIKVDLNPSQKYISMILAGLRPEIIMETCSRALSFWVYQVQSEVHFQSQQANRYEEKLNRTIQVYEKTIEDLKLELNICKNEKKAAKEEVANVKKRLEEMNLKINEKTRMHQKLLTKYDSLKRQTISPALRQSPSPMGRPMLYPSFGPDIFRNNAGNKEASSKTFARQHDFENENLVRPSPEINYERGLPHTATDQNHRVKGRFGGSKRDDREYL